MEYTITLTAKELQALKLIMEVHSEGVGHLDDEEKTVIEKLEKATQFDKQFEV
jgi:hypothetical protein